MPIRATGACDRRVRPAREPATHRARLNAARFVPREAEPTRHRGRRRLRQPRDRQPLEQQRKPRALLRPRHAHRLHAMRPALDRRHARHEQRRELTGVQVPPAVLRMIIDRHRRAAVRTGEGGTHRRLDEHVRRLLRLAELHSLHRPRLRQAHDGLVQRPIFHVAPSGRLSSPRSYPTHTLP